MAGVAEKLEWLMTSLFNGARYRLGSKDGPNEPTDASSVTIGYTLEDLSRSPVVLTEADRHRHTYVLGATGSGKTNLLLPLIQSDVRARRTVCVLDLRGDLVDRILTRLVGEPDIEHRLCLIDLRQERFVVGFNPLHHTGDAFTHALHLLAIIRGEAASWGVQIEETLRNCLLALSEARFSLLEIDRLLEDDPRFRAQVMARLNEELVFGFFERYEALSNQQRLTWRLPVLNKIMPFLAIPRIRLMLGSPKVIDWRALLDSPGQIILVSLAVDRFHHASQLVGSLVISAIQNAALSRVDQPEHARNPVHLFVDEFETMARDAFKEIIAEGRRFRLHLTLAHQNLSQLPTDLREVIRNNVGLQLLFQTGCLDAGPLAGDLIFDAPRDELRQALIAQDPGQAFLIRRGQEAVRLQTPLSPDPKRSTEAVQQLINSALNYHGLPSAQVEAAIRQRLIAGGEGRGSSPSKKIHHVTRPHDA